MQWLFLNFEIRGKEMTRTTYCGLLGAMLMNTPRTRSLLQVMREQSRYLRNFVRPGPQGAVNQVGLLYHQVCVCVMGEGRGL